MRAETTRASLRCTTVGVPKALCLEQLERFATEVMSAFQTTAKTAEPALA